MVRSEFNLIFGFWFIDFLVSINVACGWCHQFCFLLHECTPTSIPLRTGCYFVVEPTTKRPKVPASAPPPPQTLTCGAFPTSHPYLESYLFILERLNEPMRGKYVVVWADYSFFLRITFVQCLLRLISLKALHSAPHNMLVKRNSLMLTVSFAADYFIICKLQNKRLFAFHQPGRVW
jgi:hypothetical protein